MLKRYAAVCSFALALGAAPFAAFAAATPAPMPAMDMSGMDCSTAVTKMVAVMTPSSSEMAEMKNDDADKAYAEMMKMTVMHAAMASKIEMKCGKNSKAMAMAKKMEDELQDNYLTVEATMIAF